MAGADSKRFDIGRLDILHHWCLGFGDTPVDTDVLQAN